MEKQNQIAMLEALEPDRRRAPSPARAAQLAVIQARRRQGGVLALRDERGESFGYSMLQIPEQDYRVLLARFPDLASKDHEIKTRAWKAYARSAMARELGHVADDSIGKRRRNSRIIVR